MFYHSLTSCALNYCKAFPPASRRVPVAGIIRLNLDRACQIMSKTIVKPRQNGTVKPTEDISPIKNGKGHSCSPLKRLKPSDEHEGQQQQSADDAHPVHVDSDDAELARKLHEQLNGPESPTAAPITRHISRVRKAPVFYKPEFGGYQGYHGVEGGPEQEDGTGEVSPRHAKEPQIPRELRRLHEHSVSMSDSEAKSNFPAGPRRTRASSVPDPESEGGQAQRPLAARSADQGAKKRAEVKAEGDADTHSRSGTHQHRKQRSLTPELRLTRSMQPPQGSQQSHPLPTDQRKNGRSLPFKLEQPAGSGQKPALNQGSSGSPGKGTASSIQQGGIQKPRNSKPVVLDGDGTVKAEVTSNRLRQGTGGASTSGESHSHVDLAAACPDQADAVGGSGRRGSNSGAAGVSKRAKLPAKNPMVLQKQNGSYYRVRVLKEETYRVKIEFMGFEQQLQPSWLARDSERIWRGSYKNKAWKHLGDGAWEPRDVGSNMPKPAVNQAAKASKGPKSSSGAVKAAAASETARKGAASSGSGQGSKGKGRAGPSDQQQKVGKAPSALEAALQCEEDLADDAAASPGDAAAKAAGKAGDDKGKAAAAAEAAPKPVVKPRRDRKGRIRGTYGINAKPVAVETPADSPPAPGVTRASLRPKPTAKASPDDEEVEMVKPAAGARHLRAVSSGPDAGAAHDSPGSPMHIKASAPEVRKPTGRTAIQRRAAAANFAVAAAVAAEAADIMPKSIQHSSRVSAKNHSTHRRSGSNSMNRFALDHVRSGRITKALSGGSSGGGSSGGTIRFGSLMDALGELEGREGGFRPQAHSSGALSLGASGGLGGYGGTLRPALFGSGSNGFVSRWHEPLGPVSPRILTLSPELFQLGSSSHAPAGWSVPSSCHGMVDAGMSLQPQFPLFKAS
ncbi:hypothetical protein WJX82_004759 [Trebouxia sp. C0006]